MFLIGQTLNSSDEHVRSAMAGGDLAWLRATALRQMQAGMATVDVNAGALGEDEAEILRWLIPWLENLLDVGVCIDSADAATLFELARGRKHPPILNSLTLDDEWPDSLSDLVEGGARLVIQMRGGGWIPKDAEERLAYAERCVTRLHRQSIPRESVLLDPVLLPWGEDLGAGSGLLEFLERFDALPTLVGLSNASYGHADRAQIHSLWFRELRERGLSAAIVDPFDPAWRESQS